VSQRPGREDLYGFVTGTYLDSESGMYGRYPQGRAHKKSGSRGLCGTAVQSEAVLAGTANLLYLMKERILDMIQRLMSLV